MSVRGELWRVRQLQRYDSCIAVHLAGIDRGNRGQRRVLLHPFDRMWPTARSLQVGVVRRRQWMRALRGSLRQLHPHDGLRAALGSRVELLPFQLEPALATVRGLACRVLLADEVGLGKTIQAGLLLVELRERGCADRVLILTPAGLRRQWQAELSHHFSIDATVVDSPLLNRRASVLPTATNPWLLDRVAIASIDLIKRPDAMRGLESIVWDLLIVDEAHLAALAPRRHAGVDALARRARRLVLITATPHAGDAHAFASLCRLGDLAGTRLAMFRRSRAEAGLANSRRVRTLPVRLGPEESHMHELLRRYAALVMREPRRRQRETLLAIAVLMKRALSSPLSLRISIDRRVQLLAKDSDLETQLSLPLMDEDTDDRDLEPVGILRTPGLADRTLELGCLREIGAAARAVPLGRKLRVLARLIGRIREPVLVFTEYRDTLQHVAAVLGRTAEIAVIHGGLTEAERVQAQTAFTNGSARVLLATDAAGEGLNLHTRCRFVISLELPWNPMRLEQRIGRVDRLNQTRVVHALNLFARGTVERDVLARLVTRLERARQAVGHVNDPLGSLDQDDLTHVIVDSEDESHSLSSTGGDELVWQPNLREEAIAECRRLERLRRMGAVDEAPVQGRTALVTTVSSHRLKSPLASPTLLFLIRADLVDAAGQSIEQSLIPVIGPLPSRLGIQRPPSIRTLVEQAIETLRPTVLARAFKAANDRLESVRHRYRAALEASGARELALVETIRANEGAHRLFQAGLFDMRAARDRDEDLFRHALQLKDVLTRLRQIEVARSSAMITNLEPSLVLLVVDRGCAPS